MRSSDLNQHDLQNILYWYENSHSSEDQSSVQDQNTPIKIQAMLIYSQEEIELHRRRCH